MKFAAVRFVSGFCAVSFILWGFVLFAYDIHIYWSILGYPSVRPDFIRYMARDAVVLGFGIFCLIRFRHWHRKALKEKHKRDGKQDHTPL